jgi:WD40 repeat protein
MVGEFDQIGGRSMQVWQVGRQSAAKPIWSVASVNHAVFSSDGQFILTVHDKTARVWQAGTGQAVATINGHTAPVKSAVFSSNGQFIVTASDDKTARIWQVSTGQLVTILGGGTEPLYNAVFSPDNQFILTMGATKVGGFDDRIVSETVQVWQWRPQTGGPVTTLSVSGDSAVFSPDGQSILAMSGDITSGQVVDRTARLWQTRTGKPLATLRGHTAPVTSAVFSPDGRFILTASADRTARLWYARNGGPVTTLRGHTGSVISALFSPDGQSIVTASDDKTALIYPRAAFRPIDELLDMANRLEPEGLTKDERERFLPVKR